MSDEEKLHPKVQEITMASDHCVLCVAEGGLEEGLLHGFVVGVDAEEGAVRAPMCFDHRVRLSFAFDLADRIKEDARERSIAKVVADNMPKGTTKRALARRPR